MIGVLGHDSALLKLYSAGDNLGEWDEFCYSFNIWPDWNQALKFVFDCIFCLKYSAVQVNRYVSPLIIISRVGKI